MHSLTLNGITDGGAKVRIAPSPDMLNVKTGPHIAYIYVLVFFTFLVGFCFLRFPEYFPVI